MKLPWSHDRRKENDDELLSLLKARERGVVHLTHNDLDAVGCDAIHRRAYPHVISLFCSVGRFPHVMGLIAGAPGNGDILSISDLGYFSGAENVLSAIREQGWRVEWRDHHRWRDEEKERCASRCELLHIDVDTCATGLCARDLLPEDPVAREIGSVVCDYDLWVHADPRSAVLGQVLQRRENRDYVRDRLALGIFSDDRIREQYRDIQREMDRIMKKSISKAQVYGKRYRIAFAPLYGYPSETAAEMRKQLKTEMEVLVSPSGRFSLRSVPPVSHILARNFGGGGHPHAAGGNFSFTFWDRVLLQLFGRCPYAREFVEQAESLP
ncbi:MAG: phosphoesterase [Methanolinea sp.]|nr:phosphoesterase [Methanolinea sp.]